MQRIWALDQDMSRTSSKRKRKNVEPQDIEDIEAGDIDVEATHSKNGASNKRKKGGKRAKSSPVLKKMVLLATNASCPHPEASKKASVTHDSPAKNTRSKKCPPSRAQEAKRSSMCPKYER